MCADQLYQPTSSKEIFLTTPITYLWEIWCFTVNIYSISITYIDHYYHGWLRSTVCPILLIGIHLQCHKE